MPTKKIFLLIILFSAIILTGATCNKPKDLFVFKSSDSGKNWEQKALNDKKKSLASTSIMSIAIDPTNPANIFVGTIGKGILRSQNSGDTWQQTSLKQGTFYSIAINPKDSSLVYVAGNMASLGKIFKSNNSGAEFTEIYSETHAKIDIKSILIDHYNPKTLYAGLTNGAFIKSSDSGKSWLATNWFNGPIETMAMSPRDSRKMYVAIKGRYAYLTKDGGKTWQDLKNTLIDFKGANLVTAIAFDQKDDRIVYLGSHFGLVKTKDDGKKWEDTGLLLEPGKFTNVAIATSPKTFETIYIGVDTTIHKSINGGKDWIIKKITNNNITSLAINPKNAQEVYTGIQEVKD